MYKNKTKKIISIIMLLIMILSMVPLNSFAADDDFIYEDEEKTILVKYNGSRKRITIPANVKIIKKNAFKGMDIIEVNLNEGLEVIEEESFSNNKIANPIKLPSTLKTIGKFAFADNALTTIDFSQAINLNISEGSFQDNKISNELDLKTLKIIPKRAFINNSIKKVILSDDLTKIEDEAFVNNKLSSVSLSDRVEVGKDIFAGNRKYVVLKSNTAKSDKSTAHHYGHIVNPIDIEVRSVEEVYKDGKPTGEYKNITSSQKIKFNPYSEDNFFALNEKSTLVPDSIFNYHIDPDKHTGGVVVFTPDKDNFVVDVVYKKTPNPIFKVNTDAVDKLLKDKIEGDDISKVELLSLVSAFDYTNLDISKNIQLFPSSIINAEAKEYTISYSVKDGYGLSSTYELILPIAIDPMKIKIADTEWQLEDFIYNGNTVLGLSEKGIDKAKVFPGIAIPHLNPHTMDIIEVVNFNNKDKDTSVLKDLIQAGPIVFDKENKIKIIEKNSFKDIPISDQLTSFKELEYVGSNAFSGTNIGGSFPIAPKLISIGDSSFYGTKIEGTLPEMLKLKSIGSSAFEKSNISGKLPAMSKLEYIGDKAFIETDLSDDFPSLPNLKHIGAEAFKDLAIQGVLSDLLNLEYVGPAAFNNTNISGQLPSLPNVEYIGSMAFAGTKLSGQLPDMPKLEYLGDRPFDQAEITGTFPAMPKVKHIGSFSLNHRGIKGPLPEMPELEIILNHAFYGTGIVGGLPDLPKLREIGNYVFYESTLGGKFKTLPNLEVVGMSAFSKLSFEGEFPEMPKLRSIGKSAFSENAFTGSIPSMPNVEDIYDNAFGYNQFSGDLPEFPKIAYIGRYAFADNNIKKDAPFYINNHTSIGRDSFRFSFYDSEVITLLTRDGKDAPNVAYSNVHILNPFNVGFIGKNSEGDVVLKERRVVAREDGSNVIIKVPALRGYLPSADVSISKNDLVDGVYTHIYKSYKDLVDEEGGNKNDFRFDAINPEGLYPGGKTINTSISLSTLNNDTLKNGRIVIEYDELVFWALSVQSIKGVEDVIYKDGLVEIILDKDLPQGTEITLPVMFRTVSGGLESLDDIHATLFDGNSPKGYGSVKYGVYQVDPIYNSTFDRDKKKVEYINIITDDLSEDYKADIDLFPIVEQFARDFESIKITYTIDSFIDKNGAAVHPSIINNSPYRSDDGVYTCQIDNFKGSPILPALSLRFNNPAETLKSIKLNSVVEGTYIDTNGKIQTVVLKDLNELNIFPEERDGQLFSKDIKNPHYNGRHSYFYDNINERKSEFKWDLNYKIKDNISELVMKDNNLDDRMYYKAVEPNGRKLLMTAYDKAGKVIISKNISERYDFEEDIAENIIEIDLSYYNLKNGEDDIQASIITKLKDPNIDYYKEGNEGNINSFKNYISMNTVLSNGITHKDEDFAFTNVVPDNNDLATKVSIASSSGDLSYGKTAVNRFSLISKDYLNKKLGAFNYTVLIEPGHRVEDIIFKNNILSSYDISTTKNGFTKIDFKINGADVELENIRDEFDLFDIKTTPINSNIVELKIHGLLAPSPENEYTLYNLGNKTIEGIDARQYSYDEDKADIVTGEFFSVQKLVGKKDYIGKEISTKPNEEFFYRITIDNFTNKGRNDFELIDILPFKEDFNNSSYRNKLDTTKTINIPDGFKIEYLNSIDEIKVSKRNIIKDLSNANWTDTPNTNTKAIKITADKINTDESFKIDIPMITNNNLAPIYNGKTNTNQFAYIHKDLDGKQALSNPVHQEAEIDVPKKDISLTKVSQIMGEEDGVIKDVEFALKDLKGRIIDISSTDNNGKLIFKNIPANEYIVEEVNQIPGYKEKAASIYISTEDMINSDKVLDLGKVINERIDEFNFILRNVELINDLSKINYSNLKDMYNREIKNSSFIIQNIDTKNSIEININNRFGEKVSLKPGQYTIKQTKSPIDNGLDYKANDMIYMFEVDKFGNILISSGNGTELTDLVKQESKVLYFPNTVEYKTSTINIIKKDQENNLLSNAEMTLRNINTGDEVIGNTKDNGICSFDNVKPGLYSVKETKAPNGYILSDQIEIINIPINESIVKDFEFINTKLIANVNKYKIVANNIPTKEAAEDILDELASNTSRTFIIKNVHGYYQVREVWTDNEVYINDQLFKTDEKGSVLNIQKLISLSEDSVLTVENRTKIPGHYEPDKFDIFIKDYVAKDGFDGIVDIDIEVKPLKGAIYVSKYIVDETGEIDVKSEVNGTKYALYVDKGNGYELLEESTISNSNYTLFKDLNPLNKYKVVETFVPDGQEHSQIKEYEVDLNNLNGYTATVVFKNRMIEEKSSISINKIDGITGQKLSDVEFTIIDKHGISHSLVTDSNGEVVFDELDNNLAPFTIKETRAKEGYRLNSKDIVVTEEELGNNTIFTVENYKATEAPETGTFGKLPFVVSSLFLIVVAYALRKRNEE